MYINISDQPTHHATNQPTYQPTTNRPNQPIDRPTKSTDRPNRPTNRCSRASCCRRGPAPRRTCPSPSCATRRTRSGCSHCTPHRRPMAVARPPVAIMCTHVPAGRQLPCTRSPLAAFDARRARRAGGGGGGGGPGGGGRGGPPLRLAGAQPGAASGYPMILKGLERPVSKWVHSDACPHPATAREERAGARAVHLNRLGPLPGHLLEATISHRVFHVPSSILSQLGAFPPS